MPVTIRANELGRFGVDRPTLLLDEERARRNIVRMAGKAAAAGVQFRPHFKTHQSAAVGEWFRDAGAEAITVSSVDMAAYFAANGWQDITVAFPANVREMALIDALARDIRLHLVVDAPEAVTALAHDLRHRVHVWIKVDVGKRRAGIPWDETPAIRDLAQRIHAAKGLDFAGLLTHAGHTYDAPDAAGVVAIHSSSLARMRQLQAALRAGGVDPGVISIGDTPGCSLAQSFTGADEIRPGNFVFFDLMQARLGVCTNDDIAVAVACPVAGKSAARHELVLYGGAVHLSKDTCRDARGRPTYGCLATWTGDRWGSPEPGAPVISLSQEHGLVQVEDELFHSVDIGDLVIVLPAHSCLAADLYSEYLTLRGKRLPRRRSNDRVTTPATAT